MTKPGQSFVFDTDVDECLRLDVCREGRCINTVGAFRCEYCDSGYRMTQRGHCEGKCARETGRAACHRTGRCSPDPGLAGRRSGSYCSPPFCRGPRESQVPTHCSGPLSLLTASAWLPWLCLPYFLPWYSHYFSCWYLSLLVFGVEDTVNCWLFRHEARLNYNVWLLSPICM